VLTHLLDRHAHRPGRASTVRLRFHRPIPRSGRGSATEPKAAVDRSFTRRLTVVSCTTQIIRFVGASLPNERCPGAVEARRGAATQRFPPLSPPDDSPGRPETDGCPSSSDGHRTSQDPARIPRQQSLTRSTSPYRPDDHRCPKTSYWCAVNRQRQVARPAFMVDRSVISDARVSPITA
jgi:hypothetical protein